MTRWASMLRRQTVPYAVIGLDERLDQFRRIKAVLDANEYWRTTVLPTPGSFRHLYYDAASVRRFRKAASNLWAQTAIPGYYYRRFRAACPRAFELFRMFYLNEPVPRDRLEPFFGALFVREMEETGLVRSVDGGVRAEIQVVPHRDRLLFHDAPPAYRRQFVYLGPDSVTFADNFLRLLPSGRYRRGLDLCTGAGVQALTQRERVDEVVGADINSRAVEMARLNATLNATDGVEFVRSDLFEDVSGTFDVITSNTPFVFFPDSFKETCVDGYGGDLGIELNLRLLSHADAYLNPGGHLFVYATSPVIRGRDVFIERATELFRGKDYRITFHREHEFYSWDDFALYRAHAIERMTLYYVHLEKSRPFSIAIETADRVHLAICRLRLTGMKAAAAMLK